MTGSLGAFAGGAGLAVIANEVPKSGPGVIPADELESFVVAVMSGEYVVVFVPKDSEAEIARVRNVQLFVVSKETGGVGGPTGRKFALGEERGSGGIGGESLEDVIVEAFGVDNRNMAEDRVVQLRSPERCGELLGSENGSEILWINAGVVVTSLF